MKPYSFLLSLTLLLGIYPFMAGGKARADNASEYTVKAAYLYNFTKYVDWPAKAFPAGDSPLVIGILGDDPFGDALDGAVEQKAVNGHPLQVKRLEAFDGSQTAVMRKCQVLFIAYSEKDRLREILESLQGAPVLTVSEIEKFPFKGGMIQFDQSGKKIALQINLKAAQKAGLGISSKLLQISKVYSPE